jgi:hypothetical protein
MVLRLGKDGLETWKKMVLRLGHLRHGKTRLRYVADLEESVVRQVRI